MASTLGGDNPATAATSGMSYELDAYHLPLLTSHFHRGDPSQIRSGNRDRSLQLARSDFGRLKSLGRCRQ